MAGRAGWCRTRCVSSRTFTRSTGRVWSRVVRSATRRKARRDSACAPRAAPPAAGAAPTLVFVHGTSRDDKLWPEDALDRAGPACHRRRLGDCLAAWRRRRARARGAARRGAGSDLHRLAGAGARCGGRPPGATQGVIGVDSGLSHIAVALDLPHVQLYNFPTAWRTGPLAAHGHRHQEACRGHGRAGDRCGVGGVAARACGGRGAVRHDSSFGAACAGGLYSILLRAADAGQPAAPVAGAAAPSRCTATRWASGSGTGTARRRPAGSGCMPCHSARHAPPRR